MDKSGQKCELMPLQIENVNAVMLCNHQSQKPLDYRNKSPLNTFHMKIDCVRLPCHLNCNMTKVWYFLIFFYVCIHEHCISPYASCRLILSFAWAPSDSFILSVSIRYLFSNSMMINAYNMSWGTLKMKRKKLSAPLLFNTLTEKIPPSQHITRDIYQYDKALNINTWYENCVHPLRSVCIFWLACKWCVVAQPPRFIHKHTHTHRWL